MHLYGFGRAGFLTAIAADTIIIMVGWCLFMISTVPIYGFGGYRTNFDAGAAASAFLAVDHRARDNPILKICFINPGSPFAVDPLWRLAS